MPNIRTLLADFVMTALSVIALCDCCLADSLPSTTIAPTSIEEQLGALRLMGRGTETRFDEAQKLADRLLRDFPTVAAQGEIYYTLAELNASGGPDRSNAVIDTAKIALLHLQDQRKRLKLFDYLGDAYQLQQGNPGERRKASASSYLRGLQEIIGTHLPDVAPELPGVDRYDVPPNSPGYARISQLHQDQIAARQEAKRIGELVVAKRTLLDKLVLLYRNREGAALELASLVNAQAADEEEHKALLSFVLQELYRAH